jgi:hypothetical protein
VLPDGILSGSRVQFQVSGGAAGHFAQRDLSATDLTGLGELRLWIKSPRIADGSANAPFYLRFRLASATIAFGDAANTWERMIPISQANFWQMVRMNLTDLPAGIRGAVNGIRIEVLDGAPFTCAFDALLAVSERMLADVETALVATLDKQLKLNGADVPAVLYLDTGALPAAPNIRISPALIEYAPELSVPLEIRSDFTSAGFSLRPPSRGYQLYYDIEADGPASGDRATLLDFVLDQLMTTATLNVNGEYLPLDVVAVPLPAVAPPVRLPLRLRVRAWKSAAIPPAAAKPVKQLILQSEGFPG